MPLIIIQYDEFPAEVEALGKELIDVMAKHGYEAKKTGVLFQKQSSTFFTVDTGYVAPENVRFQGRGRQPAKELYDKDEIKGKVLDLLKERKDVSMNETAYVLKIQDEPWSGRVLREILTELETEGRLYKQGEKRGQRYILVENTEVPDGE